MRTTGIAAVLALAAALMGCATPVATKVQAQGDFGIEFEGLHLTAAGSMLDLRFRVLDAQKAAPMMDGRLRPLLVDAAHGATLDVPDTPVLGRIRQTARNHKILTDRTYFIMFGNPGKALRTGDKATLVLGDAKVAELTVQ